MAEGRFEIRTVRVSLVAYDRWTAIKAAMEQASQREVTYSEVLERLADDWHPAGADR